MNSLASFDHKIERTLRKSAAAITVIQRLIEAERFPLQEHISHGCSYAVFLPELSPGPKQRSVFFPKGSIGELLGLDESLLELFVSLGKPRGGAGEVILFSRREEILKEVSSLEGREGNLLLAVPYSSLKPVEGGSFPSFSELLTYFDVSRFIYSNELKRSHQLSDCKEGLGASIVFFSGSTERTNELHRALDRLCDADIGTLELWHFENRNEKGSRHSVHYLKPYCPGSGKFFPTPSREGLVDKATQGHFELGGKTPEELALFSVPEAIEWCTLLPDVPPAIALRNSLQQAMNCTMKEHVLADSVQKISHGQRELFSLVHLLNRSFSSFDLSIIGEFQRYEAGIRPFVERGLEQLGKSNLVKPYQSSPQFGVNNIVVDNTPVFQCTVQGFTCSEGLFTLDEGLGVVSGSFQSGKTTLLRESFAQASWRASGKDTMRLEAIYEDFGTVPPFSRYSCGRAAGISQQLADWYSHLPESRRLGLRSKDFVVERPSSRSGHISYQGVSFGEISEMSFEDLKTRFAGRVFLEDPLRLLVGLGLGQVEIRDPAGDLFGSVRKKLHVVARLGALRKQAERVATSRRYLLLLGDELFSALPSESIAVLSQELQLLIKRGILSVVSACFHDISGFPGAKFRLIKEADDFQLCRVDE